MPTLAVLWHIWCPAEVAASFEGFSFHLHSQKHQNISKHIRMLRTRFLLNFDSDFQELWKATKALSYPVIVVVYRLVHACETSPEHNKIRPAIHFQVTCWRFSVEDRMVQHVQSFTERRNMFQNVSTWFRHSVWYKDKVLISASHLLSLHLLHLLCLLFVPKFAYYFVRVQGRVWRHVNWSWSHSHGVQQILWQAALPGYTWSSFLPGRGSQPWKFGVAGI